MARRMRRSESVTKIFYSSRGSRAAMETQYPRDFLFVLHHPETLSTGLLNGMKTQEVRVIKRAEGRKRRPSLRTED